MTPYERGREIREYVLLGLGCLVVIAWIVVVLIHSVYPSHDIPTEVHGIAFIVASALFGTAWASGRKAAP